MERKDVLVSNSNESSEKNKTFSEVVNQCVQA